MKTIRALVLAVMTVSVTLASQVLAGPGGQIGIGNRVAAMWSNGGYFLGTVTEIEGARFNILFEDGDRLAVDSSRVVPLSENTSFNVGDRVVAAWKGISMYPGVVTKVHAKSCMVKWDDGDAPLLVAKDKIFHADKAVAATTAVTTPVTVNPIVSDQTFKVGDHVMAVWKSGQKYPGVISQVEGNHFLVRWDDGDTPLWVAKEGISPLEGTQVAAATGLNVGDHVMAVWKNGQRYPGVISQVEGNQFLVRWDDGDTPLWVAREGISPLEGTRVTTATGFNVGDHVAAQWRDYRYYPGVVTEVRGSQCLVKWDDGDEPLFVLQENIRALSNAPAASLNAGDHVLATWKDGHKYPGIIAEVRGNLYLIRWDDGDEPMLVTKDKILPFPQQQVRLLPGATPGR